MDSPPQERKEQETGFPGCMFFWRYDIGWCRIGQRLKINLSFILSTYLSYPWIELLPAVWQQLLFLGAAPCKVCRVPVPGYAVCAAGRSCRSMIETND